MSDSEQDRRETLADIVAEMRRGTKLPGYWRSCDLNEILNYHADHIEAAWKRQMSQSWHHREMEELIARHEREVAELRKQTGNAAALRETLDEIIDKIDNWRTGGTMEHWQYSQLFDIADAALSAPARNCDTDKDVKTLLEEYIAMRGFTSDNQIRALYELALPVIEWLLATAAERKGEGA